MKTSIEPEKFTTVVIGGGQAGLSVGYHLAKRNHSFIILDANTRIGDSWRKRWDSLHLFTPARYCGLAGYPFPAPKNYFPSKNEMADYLEDYGQYFELPVKTGCRIDGLYKEDNKFILTAGNKKFKAENVVVAMANYQNPWIPSFANELNPSIVQIHSKFYRNPTQLKDGPVLIVGAGNSGAEIALEISKSHPTWMSGRDTGHIPFRINGLAGRLFLVPLVLRFFFHRVLTLNTPLGRKIRTKVLTHGGPLIRVKPTDMTAAGIKRMPRMVGVQNGLPLLDDQTTLEVENIIWCTGFRPDFSWINFPVFGEMEPKHSRGVVSAEPGLYFVGLNFLYALSSTMIHGVGRDAEYIAKTIASNYK